MSRDYAAQTASEQAAAEALVAFVMDAGHGWLCVDSDAFPEAVRWASRFSFIGEGQVFLEEDEDAPRFIEEFGVGYAVKDIPNQYLSDEEGDALRGMRRGIAEFEEVK